MKEQKTETLPTLVDNTEKFKIVEKQTSPALTKPLGSAKIVYPKRGDFLWFEGQRFVVTKELHRRRFVIKWHSGG